MSSYKDEATLKELYVEQNLSMAEVGEELDCSSDTVSRWINKFDIETGRLTNEERDSITLSDRKHEIIKGTLMGDGCILRRDSDNVNPQYRICMKNDKFVNWLYDELQPLASSVKRRTGEYAETLENEQEILTTYSHPLLNKYANWYESGQKRWPTNEPLTELELKMLYVTDGSPIKNPDNWAAKISAINECDRKNEVSDMFKDSLNIDISWHSSSSETDGVIYIPSEYADMIWSQNPPPGFAYKWPQKGL